MGTGHKDLLILVLTLMLRKCLSDCGPGFTKEKQNCVDFDECEYAPEYCGRDSQCFNTNGSYYCQCKPGYYNIGGQVNLTATSGQCIDINECLENPGICGSTAECKNLPGSFECTCRSGYINDSRTPGDCSDVNECLHNPGICGDKADCKNLPGSFQCTCRSGYTNGSSTPGDCRDINECVEAEINDRIDICGEKGTCKNSEGSYWCKCHKGYTNYGIKTSPCTELKCDKFSAEGQAAPASGSLASILSMMRTSCLDLLNPSAAGEEKAHGEVLLEKLFTATDAILSPGPLNSSQHVSSLLSTMENSIMFIGPQLKDNVTKMESSETEAVIAVKRGKTQPTGPIHLTNDVAELDTDWETATGTGTYPGFALAALLSYKNLDPSVDGSYNELTHYKKDGVDPTFNVSSRVVSVVVSNPSTQHLNRSVNITLRHLKDITETNEVKYICAYWNERGAWSTDGCYHLHSTASHTVCTCEHLSSFAVLMALYPMEHPFELVLLTKIGLIISILCLILSILTFKFCRSIQGTRTTIHLHLCICLFVADVVFLAGIGQTKPEGGCRFVAAMLHYFFLGVFSWMLLEGVQLYRMVVRVFNATIRPLYLYISGYGTPLVVVIISAISRPQGYGTDKHCWLSSEDGLIWSFFGPVCFIIVVNVYFFIITVWKLAQKFTSLNPDLSELHKIKAFTVTAIAQMCILGLMWVFGAFLFTEQSRPNMGVVYIFTVLNSLQGALVFIMHCLLSKQVREEYAHFLACVCTTPKKRYSDLSTTNPSSSQSQASRSGDQTGESQI